MIDNIIYFFLHETPPQSEGERGWGRHLRDAETRTDQPGGGGGGGGRSYVCLDITFSLSLGKKYFILDIVIDQLWLQALNEVLRYSQRCGNVSGSRKIYLVAILFHQHFYNLTT